MGGFIEMVNTEITGKIVFAGILVLPSQKNRLNVFHVKEALMLQQKDIDIYHEQGYLCCEGVISQDTLREIRDVISQYREESARLTSSDGRFDIGPGHSPSTPQLRRIKDPVIQHPVFDKLMRSDALVDIVASLFGTGVRFDHSKLNFKPPSGNAKIEWHQDWAFYPHTNDDLLAIGVLIEDCAEENGPLLVIPGSHKGEVYDHHFDGVFAGGVKPELIPDLDQAVALTAPAGSITIHHVRTLHASAENTSDRDRPLLLYSYSAVDAFPVAERIDITEYDSRIVRGEPVLAARQTAVPVRIPYPRRDGQDSIFDNQAQLIAAT